MTVRELFFSDDRPKTICRHISFWLCWFLYIAFTQLRNQTPDQIGLNNFIVYQAGVSANRVILQMLFCYPFIYLVVPCFFQNKRYKAFTTATIFMIIGLYCITYIDYFYIWSDSTSPIFFNIPRVKPLTKFQSEYFAIYSNFHCTGTLVALSIILSVKYYKNWFKKDQENEMLIQQNAQAELQLLKAQVHPHFLFNTLNNIYSLLLDDSPKAITVLNELSGMVLYMTHEGANPSVPVNKEIKMLMDYIGLEKIRYGERLEMVTDVCHSQENNLFIAPLLMIPFVENSFKHGASKTMNKTIIHLFISIENEWLIFNISNNIFPAIEEGRDRLKIGLHNVKKRLLLLYPEKHILQFHSSNDIFSVNMKIYLGKNKTAINERISQPIASNPIYAK